MKLLEKILVPTDFRGSADSAIQMAIALAKIFHSKIILLHVLQGDLDAKTPVDLTKLAADQLAIVREKINKEGVQTAEPLVAAGNLFEEMVKAAENNLANIIMMGSGDKADNNFPLGTTTEKVMRKSNKPVWVVKRNAPVTIDQILCPIDYSEPSKRALGNAIHLARGLKAELTVMTVMESLADQLDGLKVDLAPESEKLSPEEKAQFDAFLADFDFHGVTWNKQIRRGKPYQEILRALKKKENNLLLMGTTGKTGFDKFLMGSVTERVTREVPSSFITVKSKDIILVRIEDEIHDMETHLKEGRELLANGLAREAIKQFEQSLAINNLYALAWLGLAHAYERLEKNDQAEKCHARVKDIRRQLSDRKIEAELRSRHWLYR